MITNSSAEIGVVRNNIYCYLLKQYHVKSDVNFLIKMKMEALTKHVSVKTQMLITFNDHLFVMVRRKCRGEQTLSY